MIFFILWGKGGKLLCSDGENKKHCRVKANGPSGGVWNRLEFLVQFCIQNWNLRRTCREIGKHTISPFLCPHSLFHQLQELRVRDVYGGGVGWLDDGGLDVGRGHSCCVRHIFFRGGGGGGFFGLGLGLGALPGGRGKVGRGRPFASAGLGSLRGGQG